MHCCSNHVHEFGVYEFGSYGSLVICTTNQAVAKAKHEPQELCQLADEQSSAKQRCGCARMQTLWQQNWAAALTGAAVLLLMSRVGRMCALR